MSGPRHKVGAPVWLRPVGTNQCKSGVVAEIKYENGRFYGSYVILLDDGRRYHALGSEVEPRLSAWDVLLAGYILPE